MSDIVLSAGVRQNLLSLQSTARLMGLTQNRLATGKRVNTALDNPSNFFTSQSLSNRARDLNALLDSIGQAQKTLEAADQGISSLTKLVESAKSIAKQARQAPQPSAVTYGTINVGATADAETLADHDGGTIAVADSTLYSFTININGAGLIPEFRGSGGTAILYSEMFKSVSENPRYQHADVVQIGIENENMVREMDNFGIQFYKMHRTYKKDL